MSYTTSDKRIEVLKSERRQLVSAKQDLERRVDELCEEVEAEKQRNAKLFEAAEKWMAKAAHFEAENTKLRELAQRLFTEYRYMRVRPRRMYLEHETRMRIIEDEMRSLGIEVDE